jgi:hypothetical protein
MLELDMVIWAVGIAVWVVFAAYVIWIARRVWKDRLMRCPETGTIALVGVDYEPPEPGGTPRLVVRRCGLWPSRAGCARRCLERYENLPGFPPDLKNLRPTDRA